MQFDRLHPEAVIEMIGAAEEYERRQSGLVGALALLKPAVNRSPGGSKFISDRKDADR